MSGKERQLALELGRRQKRLNYWLKHFPLAQAPDTLRSKLGELYGTYTLLIAKLEKARGKADDECKCRLISIEAQIDSLFQAHRLLTSTAGRPAVGESS